MEIIIDNKKIGNDFFVKINDKIFHDLYIRNEKIYETYVHYLPKWIELDRERFKYYFEHIWNPNDEVVFYDKMESWNDVIDLNLHLRLCRLTKALYKTRYKSSSDIYLSDDAFEAFKNMIRMLEYIEERMQFRITTINSKERKAKKNEISVSKS